jgi:hypothetical protein
MEFSACSCVMDVCDGRLVRDSAAIKEEMVYCIHDSMTGGPKISPSRALSPSLSPSRALPPSLSPSLFLPVPYLKDGTPVPYRKDGPQGWDACPISQARPARMGFWSLAGDTPRSQLTGREGGREREREREREGEGGREGWRGGRERKVERGSSW